MADRFHVEPFGHKPRESDARVEILTLLDPYDHCDVLASNHIAALLGKPERDTNKILTAMVRHGLLERFTLADDDNYRELMKYVRLPAGARYLAEHGHPSSALYDRKKSKQAHQIFGGYIQTSLIMGVRAYPNFSLDVPRQILSHRNTPEATRNSDYPFSFHVNGRRLTPDWKPNILRRKDPRDAKLLLREDDRDTEGITSKTGATSIREKAERYHFVFQNRLYYQKYGINSAVLLFTTLNEERKQNIMAEWAKVTGPCSYALFKAKPQYRSVIKRVDPTPTIFTDPWDRIGHPPYYLSTLSENPA
jgi:hypothetical protein